MPEISRFNGIVVFMNYNDHLPPHFHARYQNEEVTVTIDTAHVTGTMTRHAVQLIFEWMLQHREELRENWELARRRKPLRHIPPLP